MKLYCQPEIQILSSNCLPGTLPLFHWPKKMLPGTGISIAYKLSHNEDGKKAIKDLNWSNGIQCGQCDEQLVPYCVRSDNWM